MNWIKRLIERFFPSKTRREKILDEYGCVCFCPVCKDFLQDQAELTFSKGPVVKYKCNRCFHVSKWLYDAPVPILLEQDCPEGERNTWS